MVGTSELMGVAEGAHFLHFLPDRTRFPYKYIRPQSKSREGRLDVFQRPRESLLTTADMYIRVVAAKDVALGYGASTDCISAEGPACRGGLRLPDIDLGLCPRLCLPCHSPAFLSLSTPWASPPVAFPLFTDTMTYHVP